MHRDAKQNLIKDKQIIIGIDIAKHCHYASIIENSTEKIIKMGFKIPNTKDGFSKFEKEIKKWNKNNIIIGMEPTGHYWKVINNWLVNNGYKTVFTNPYHVKLSKELHNNLNNKNDKKDSLIIAKMVRSKNILNILTIEKEYIELRQLSLIRCNLIKDLSREKNRLKSFLDEFIPEYCDCFKDPSRITSISFLERFLVKQLTSKKQTNKKINLIYKISRGIINKAKAKKIVNILSETIGVKTGIDSAECRLELIIKKIKLYLEEIKKIETKLKFYLLQTKEAKYMLSMKGIGIITLSSLLGQTGNLNKFSHPMQLQKFTGMIPVQNKSGKFEGKTKLSKRGNHKARNAIYKIAISLICNNAEMKKLYNFKLETFKQKKLVALTSIASKALRILFKLGKYKIPYDERIVQGFLKIT